MVKWLAKSRTLLIVLVAAVPAASCQTGGKPLPVSVLAVTQQEYRTVRADVTLPPKPNLQSYNYDYPRRTDVQQQVKSTTACRAVKPAAQNKDFWRRCGEFPIDTSSNLYIGYTKPEWQKQLKNWEEVEAYVSVLEERIAEVNRQRQEDRQRASEPQG